MKCLRSAVNLAGGLAILAAGAVAVALMVGVGLVCGDVEP